MCLGCVKCCLPQQIGSILVDPRAEAQTESSARPQCSSLAGDAVGIPVLFWVCAGSRGELAGCILIPVVQRHVYGWSGAVT